MGIHVHKRKAGAHRKTEKAVRRQEKVATQREVGRVARHLAFNQFKDGFESLTSHHNNKRMAIGPVPEAALVMVPETIPVASRLLFQSARSGNAADC